MSKFVTLLTRRPSPGFTQFVLGCMRIGIGILTIGHGLPKIIGGFGAWQELGTYIAPLGIHFFPMMWGFLAACTEFFGGVAFTIGLGTRLASILLTFMMVVAFMWHFSRGDSFTLYSFPLTLVIIFASFILLGGGTWSVDNILYKMNARGSSELDYI
jgi:putative oxidoreductase